MDRKEREERERKEKEAAAKNQSETLQIEPERPTQSPDRVKMIQTPGAM